MSKYILSTMTNSVAYTYYHTIDGLPTPTKKVLIHGGATLPSTVSGVGDRTNDEQGRPIWTAAGVVTPISDEAYEGLKDHHVFKRHMEAGYLQVVNHDISGSNREIDKRAATMDADGMRQLTPGTLKSKVKVKLDHPDNNHVL